MARGLLGVIRIRTSTRALRPSSMADRSPSRIRIAPGGRAVNDMTGTLRDYRGRGLAQLAKRATLVNAAKRGVELVSTDNDETNAPMLRTQREARLSANRQQAHVV